MTADEEIAALRKRVEELEKGFLIVSASLERVTSILEMIEATQRSMKVTLTARGIK